MGMKESDRARVEEDSRLRLRSVQGLTDCKRNEQRFQ